MYITLYENSKSYILYTNDTTCGVGILFGL